MIKPLTTNWDRIPEIPSPSEMLQDVSLLRHFINTRTESIIGQDNTCMRYFIFHAHPKWEDNGNQVLSITSPAQCLEDSPLEWIMETACGYGTSLLFLLGPIARWTTINAGDYSQSRTSPYPYPSPYEYSIFKIMEISSSDFLKLMLLIVVKTVKTFNKKFMGEKSVS